MQDLSLDDFDFDLPDDLIALRPARPRRASRLLVAHGSEILDSQFADLPDWLEPGDLLVFNDTKVIPARLEGERRRETRHGSGTAAIEVTLLSPDTVGDWTALAKPAKRLTAGDAVTFSDALSAQVLDRQGGEVRLRFNLDGDRFGAALEAAGKVPLPPYIASRRAADMQDRTDYQTVFARVPGAVAAPTASLHFDDTVLGALSTKGIKSTFVTLHVGAGTFLPVMDTDISRHKMHSEWGEVSAAAAEDIRAAQARGNRVIPVGTTALRLLETAARGGEIKAWRGDTDIFIRPGFHFNATDALITNFHLPKSTLLMLVSALMGMESMARIYTHAVDQRYRFFSYGDSSLLIPPK